MELLNALYKYDLLEVKNAKVFKDCYKSLILLLAPCAPHFAEEMWQIIGNKTTIFNAKYPVCDENALVRDEVEVAVQINSKMKAKIMLANGLSEEEIKTLLFAHEKIGAELQGKQIKKLIIVPKRLINIIV
jgi:leucyl-tRNA synthetase